MYSVIIDIGSDTCKAGFSYDYEPKVVFPSVTGRVKEVFFSFNRNDLYPEGVGEHFVGDKIRPIRDLLVCRSAIDRGRIVNWDDMEAIYEHIFYHQLRIPTLDNPSIGQPVLHTDYPLACKEQREKVVQLMFEVYNLPAMCLANQGVLGLYAAGGRTAGLAVDSGHGTTTAVPVYEGCALPHATGTLEYAGRDLDQRLLTMLNALGYAFTWEIQDSYGIISMIYDSIMKCDSDLHRMMYSNIILSGGSTMFPGFSNKVNTGIHNIGPCGCHVHEKRVQVIAPDKRRFGAWIGGSVLASMSTFKQMCINKRDYDEEGPRIVHKICL